ncbi:serine hydrolase domain-containing protein [Algoriphagus sp.]|uniref:serine hydrolase domain-containing protein n=1 Tax=Algoriphagus sp. TaxID=1872435 RepID=UPI002608438A|nr:serine hydrolase domain-containing protein [Algoriphagus sp.]
MRIFFLILFFLIWGSIQGFSQDWSPQFEKYLKAGMEERQIPGMITAVFLEDKLVYSQTHGLRTIEQQLPVDPHTVFNLGSATKPFIGIAMAMLVEEGKVNWEDKVKAHYPDFQLSDEGVTADARIQDLFLHNLGIAADDLLWTLDSTSTEVMLSRYSMAEKIHPMRADFHYNNMLYVIAGEVIKAVSGKHWTEFVEENIFLPLEMNHSFSRAGEVPAYGNYATPYLVQTDNWIPHPLNLADQMGAAGNIWSCLEDMEHFLEFLVNQGKYKDRELLSRDSFQFLIRSHTLESSPEMDPLYEGLQSNFRTYGIGWFLHDYRGEKVAYHPGSIEGLNAQIGFVPSKKLAFFTMCNRDWAELWRSTFYKAIDLWAYQDDSRDHSTLAINPTESFFQEWETKKAEDKNSDALPTITTEALIGIYIHPMYGKAEVNWLEDGLRVHFNEYLSFELAHWFGNTYLGKTQNKFLGWDDYFEFENGSLLVFGERFVKQ